MRDVQAFHVNGDPVEVSDDGTTPLLTVLRETLGLKGSRFGCGQGACGACTVIVDGRAVMACDMPVSAVAGSAVETIEGLTSGPERHPLVDAILDHQAAQCGYCLPGIIMSAKALLDATPHPDRTAIRAALNGNLCRCGAHVRVLCAIESVARAPEPRR